MKILNTLVITIFAIILLISLTGCSSENIVEHEIVQNVQEEVQNIDIENELISEEEENIKAGNYTLEYGIYTDKYGTTYVLNSDGTYTCESNYSEERYSNSGNYIIYNLNDYEEEISQINEPIGFSGDWMIAFNYNGKDESKPYLIYSYNINTDNEFYNGQTDEIWTYQGK